MFKKMILLALVAALAFTALPVGNVYAAGLTDETTPPQKKEWSDQDLEEGWQRVLSIHERLGKNFERADRFIEHIQTLIDKADEKGMDIAAVQTALDDFADAVKDADSIYESATGIINSHQGFDVDGKVTDAEKAIETIKSLVKKNRELRALVRPSARALRKEIRAFREANPRPQKTEDDSFSPAAGH